MSCEDVKNLVLGMIFGAVVVLAWVRVALQGAKCPHCGKRLP